MKVWRTCSTEHISLGMFLVMLLSLVPWLLYDVLSSDVPIIVANANRSFWPAGFRSRS